MSTEQRQEGSDPAPTAELGGKGAARRRFARAGLGASGVIMSLASEPGMAATLMCKAPSAALSGALMSVRPVAGFQCEGLSPGYWMNHSWPVSVRKTVPFGSLFDCSTGWHSADYKKATLGALINKTATFTDGANDIYEIGRHMVAAYLNIKSGRTSFLTEQALKNIWYEYMLTGGGSAGRYKVNATVSWDGTQIVSYLKSTMS